MTATAASGTAAISIPFVDLTAEFREVGEEAAAAMTAVLARGDFILGGAVREFEAEFAAWCGTAHCVGVATGTDALELALRACGIGAGDEVITAPNSFIASAAAISHTGATPVFADVDPVHYTLDPEAVRAAITPRTRAIVPVHLYGQCADMEPILQLARKHDLRVVEDACQAHGAAYHGLPAGTMGDCGCFSFYPAKNLGCCGDGGALVTNDPELAGRVRMLRNYGQSRKYHHDVLAFNSRLDTVQAAVLRVKLPRLGDWNRRRREAAARYDRLLAQVGLAGPAVRSGCDHVFHLYEVRLPAGARDRVFEQLNARGISVGLHYPVPIHRQRAYEELGVPAGSFPAAEEACRGLLSLPIYPQITPGQQAAVVRALAEVL